MPSALQLETFSSSLRFSHSPASDWPAHGARPARPQANKLRRAQADELTILIIIQLVLIGGLLIIRCRSAPQIRGQTVALLGQLELWSFGALELWSFGVRAQRWPARRRATVAERPPPLRLGSAAAGAIGDEPRRRGTAIGGRPLTSVRVCALLCVPLAAGSAQPASQPASQPAMHPRPWRPTLVRRSLSSHFQATFKPLSSRSALARSPSLSCTPRQ